MWICATSNIQKKDMKACSATALRSSASLCANRPIKSQKDFARTCPSQLLTTMISAVFGKRQSYFAVPQGDTEGGIAFAFRATHNCADEDRPKAEFMRGH
jgi:hypothetical protein